MSTIKLQEIESRNLFCKFSNPNSLHNTILGLIMDFMRLLSNFTYFIALYSPD